MALKLQTFIEHTQKIPLLQMVVLQGGQEIARKEWEPEIRQNQYSASKSFTSAAVGIAVKEGLLRLDTRVADFFRDELPDHPSDALSELTLYHLLTMSVGQKEAHLMGTQRVRMAERDWVSYALRQEFSDIPGTRFLYNNVGPYLAGIMVQRCAGTDLPSYLAPRLFEPLGIWKPTWEMDPNGYTFGAGGLFLSVSELAQFGQLYLQNGTFGNKEILPKEWVQMTAMPQIKTGNSGNCHSEYSLLFWNCPDGAYRADGKYGQYSIVLPEKDAVVAINAFCRGEGDILQYVWTDIVPLL